jgi:hypothetical protein
MRIMGNFIKIKIDENHGKFYKNLNRWESWEILYKSKSMRVMGNFMNNDRWESWEILKIKIDENHGEFKKIKIDENQKKQVLKNHAPTCMYGTVLQSLYQTLSIKVYITSGNT